MSRGRSASILTAIYALPAAVGVFAARVLVPTIIRDAYHGRSLPLLNRVFQRRISHPVEHYEALWRSFWEALLLAWLLHLIVVLVILATDCGTPGERSPESRRAARSINCWLVAFALAFLLVTVLSGARQDYVAFLEIWTAERAGHDPWYILKGAGYPLNAYGPLFNVFTLPAWWNPLAPKLLFALAYCLFAVIFLKRGLARPGPGPGPGGFPTRGLMAWLLLSPFPWVEVAYYGHFDVLVAIVCVAAAAFLRRGREVLSGASLALGFLLKLIPIVIVPFFALDGRRVRVRFLAGAALPMALGYGVSALIWGPSTFRPFAFAYHRGSTLMSIFRFLRGEASPLRRFLDHPNLDNWSTPCLAVAGLLVFLACQWRRADPTTSALLAILTTLLFYRVGFIQYQMIPFLLMASWLGRYAPVLARRRGLAVAIGGYFGWLSLFDVFYIYAGGVIHPRDRWGWVAEWVGLPTFLLGLFLLISLLRVAGRTDPDRGWEAGHS